MEELSFYLKPRPPFSLMLTVWALRRRPNNQIDRWHAGRYTRILLLDNLPYRVTVLQGGTSDTPRLHVTVSGRRVPESIKRPVSSLLEKMFSLKKDLADFYLLTGRERRLRPITDRFVGVRPPRFPTVFEALVNAFACQQLSLDLGIILLNRLAASYGVSFNERDETFNAFPRPQDLAGLSPEDFRKLGFSRSKGRAIVELSGAVARGDLVTEDLDESGDEDVLRRLTGIRGVGRWSAEYVLLRGLGRLNVFPGDDVGAQKNLQNFFGLSERPHYETVRKITSRWRPYAGFVYFHFLLDKLRAKGSLS